MEAIYQTICAVLVLINCYIAEGFRIRRSGLAGYDDPYGLTNAFSDIDQEDTYRTLLRKRVIDPDDTYFNPNEESIGYISDQSYIPSAPVSYIPNDIVDYGYGSVEDLPLQYAGLNGRMFGPQKRTPHNPHRVVPTLDELRTIFGEADVPMKKLAPVKRQEPTTLKQYNKHEDKANFDKENRAEAFRKLLNAAVESQSNVVSQNSQTPAKPDSKDASQTDALKSDNTHADVQGKELTQGLGTVSNDNSQLSKSKRASEAFNDIPSDYVMRLLEEISGLKEKVAKLEMMQLLEETENDYLASALKYATIDQLEDSEAFVDKEYEDINKATETETLIQTLADDDVADQKVEEGEQVIEALGEELKSHQPDVLLPVNAETEKRAESPDVPSSAPTDEWYDTPVQENVGYGAVLEDTVDKEENVDPRSPVILPIAADEADESDDTEDDEPEDMDWLDGSDVEQLSPEPGLSTNDLSGDKTVLAELINNLSPSTVDKIIADLRTGSTCPAADSLSQNCAYADVRGIPMDDEARQLCIRHQICYTCGSVLDMPQLGCDHGYKETVGAACGGDSTCLRDGAYFLSFMKSVHTFLSISPLECRAPCVEKQILGVN